MLRKPTQWFGSRGRGCRNARHDSYTAPPCHQGRQDGLSDLRSSIDQRLKKLEGTRYSGPRILFSAFPLPDDPVERDAYVDGLLASGEATLKNGMLNARTLTVEEWMAQVVAAGLARTA